jgi:hypothetical protein
MKYFLVLGAAFFASVSSAQAIECAAELPAARSGHWSYRIVDGRKCWYQGKTMLPRSQLHWRAPAASLSNAQARMRLIDHRDFVDPEDGSCCWPAVSNDGFESRWRGLFEVESAGIGSRK